MRYPWIRWNPPELDFPRTTPNRAPAMSPSNLEILAYEATNLGPLCLRRRELLSSPGTLVTDNRRADGRGS